MISKLGAQLTIPKKRQGLQKKQTIENDLLLKCQRPRMQGPRSNFWIEGAECLASQGGGGWGNN